MKLPKPIKNLKKGLIILLAVLPLFLTGCSLPWSQDEEENGDQTDGFPTEPVTLIWWGLWEPNTHVAPIIKAYQQQHPNVTIEYTKREFTNYKASLKQRLSDNQPQTSPDIMRIHNTWLPTFESYLTLLPEQIMDSNTYSNTFYPTAVTDFTGKDGNIYAIPLEIDGLGLYYNKNLLKAKGYSKPAESWDDLADQAKNLTVSEGNTIKQAGVAMGTGSNVTHSLEIMSLLMMQNGSTMVSSDKSRTTFGTDSAAATAMTYYTNFATNYSVWDSTLPTDLDLFAEGNLAMMFAPSFRVFDIKVANPSLDFDIAPVPQLSTSSNTRVDYSTYWGEAVSKDSAYPQVAWDFLQFAAQQEQLRSFYNECRKNRAFGEPYPRKDMASELSDATYAGAYITMASTMRTWYMVDEDNVRIAFEKAADDVASGTSVENALEDAAATVDKVLTSTSVVY